MGGAAASCRQPFPSGSHRRLNRSANPHIAPASTRTTQSLCASYPTGGRFVGPRPNANDSTVQDPLRDHYTCTYVMLLAHAEAAAALRASPNGAGAELSIISDSSWLRPNTSSAADAAAVDRYMLWHLALWFEPVVTGSWPPEVVRAAGDRLPAFSPAQSAALRNSSTMLGINHYSTMLGAARTCALPAPGEAGDASSRTCASTSSATRAAGLTLTRRCSGCTTTRSACAPC